MNGYESGGNRKDLVSGIHGLSYVHGKLLPQDGMHLVRSHLDSYINNTKQTNKRPDETIWPKYYKFGYRDS